MRYVNRKDERLRVPDETCTCGHSSEEHQGPDGVCQGSDEESGKPCDCTCYQPEESELVLVL